MKNYFGGGGGAEQPEDVRSLEQVLQIVVSHPAWILRLQMLLTTRLSLQPLKGFIIKDFTHRIL